MDVVKVVDLWQVILQEPRVANKAATMLLQTQIEQSLVRDKLDKEKIRQQETVQNVEPTDERLKISDRRRKNKSKDDYLRSSKKKSSVKNSSEIKSIMTSNHIDLLI